MTPASSAASERSSAYSEHRLKGLEPDNLLAFLSLIGLLRSLETTRPTWRARSYWDVEHAPTRPVLTVDAAVTPMEIAGAAALACEHFEADYNFGTSKLNEWTPGEARRFLAKARDDASPERSARTELLSSLTSDAAILASKAAGTRSRSSLKQATKGQTIISTPMCQLFGQGHQYFLERLSQALRLTSRATGGRGKPAAVRTGAEAMHRALFEPWLRTEKAPTFRWDHEEARRYALRANEPASQPVLTVAGAQALAVLGFALFTVVPSTEREHVRLQTVAIRSRNGTEITIPIWSKPLGLSALRSLLSHPTLAENSPDLHELEPYAVFEIRRAKRISLGKYLNFTRADAL